MRRRTLKQIDAAGHDVRLWCFRCARGMVLEGSAWIVFVERKWADDLESAARRFKCRTCLMSDEVAIFPASRENLSWKGQVERFFHSRRSDRKKMRRVK